MSDEQIQSFRFKYHGQIRHVDNATIDTERALLIGYEMRKEGRFSYGVKKFKLAEIEDLEAVEPMHRSGPIVGRPE